MACAFLTEEFIPICESASPKHIEHYTFRSSYDAAIGEKPLVAMGKEMYK